jgi:hypothetical protein
MTRDGQGSGYLVVERRLGTESNPSYAGIDRVPTAHLDDLNDRPALRNYILGDSRNDETNLIGRLDEAQEVCEALMSEGCKVEIVFCSVRPRDDGAEHAAAHVEHLGFDVAGVRSGYWSIVGDIANGDWVAPFRPLLNSHGLFGDRGAAERYLEAYRAGGEADAESPFDVVRVTRIRPWS